MRNNKKLSFTSINMISYLLILIIVISVFQFFISPILKDKFTSLAIKNIEASSDSLASEVELYFNSTNVLIGTVENALDSFDVTDEELLNKFFHDSIEGKNVNLEFELLDQNGIIYYTYPENIDRIGIDMSNQQFLLDTTETETTYWTKPYRSITTGETVITISVKNDDWYLVAHLPLQKLDEVYNGSTASKSDADLMILDPYGIYIYDSRTELEDIRYRFSYYESLASSNDSNIVYFELDNIDMVGTYHDIEFTNWILVVYEPTSNIANTVNILFSYISYSVGLVITLSILSASYNIITINSHFRKYIFGLKEISKGNLEYEFQKSSITEINQMSEGLNDMSSNLLSSMDKLETIAYFDSLTSLPNRENIKSKFDELAINSSEDIAMLLINIRRFSLINDSFGYEYGNAVLIELSNIFKDLVCEDVHIARIEGNSFLVVTKLDEMHNVNKIVNNFNNRFKEDVMVENINLKIKYRIASILFPEHGKDFETLFTHLTQSLLRNPIENEYGVVDYNPNLEKQYERQIEIELSLEEAFANNDFYPVFHPMISFKDKSIRGFEALARWNHDKLGAIGPAEFVPILERTRNIQKLDKHIIFESLKMVNQLTKQFKTNYVLSCNVSVETILRDDFVDFIKQTINKFGYNPIFLS